ncbi:MULTISPECIES: hypothetical protein [Pseudonocardia]|uniref:Uncharacterized protein n=2 Tax=Pseudonocardia TaxID=1847 RepID=A0A1Y2N8S0_PSEAH|nr:MULTISPECIES: hypothetical protein [Pseudonocardia]OSY43885.1 hypothetical protein BG845_00004 [Pseudonocardia autotrophica]TDN74380.1 hypothetical protein C8E95_3501 [Pseudonocardia autotrophica]BBG05146.1 hypothetical protein Pdca_63550 [Pseudonocardia autotrophica]GEC27941.1 hypothetical protein PSA01_49700 [Pseudonocardia saturnea]
MLDPVGPLPASVYWRRRAVAVGAALLALFAMLWLTTWLLVPGAAGENTTPTGVAAVSTSDNGAAAPASPAPESPAPGAPQPPLPATADPGASPGSADERESTGPAAPNAGPVDETVRPDDTPRPSVLVPDATSSPATGPVPCADGMIEVRAETGQPSYPADASPELRLVVTNISGEACVRDLDGAEQEIAVWSGNGADKLWSSNDCSNPATDDLRTLVPGEPVAFAVTWSGLRSEPGCAAQRARVEPGGYRVLARLGAVVSPPAPLLMG